MTIQPVYPDERFEFDKADRLRRALRVSHTSVGAMAGYLEVDRNTVSNWINGRANPRTRDLKRFALKTGFPFDWLETGTGSAESDGPDGGGGVTGRYQFGVRRHGGRPDDGSSRTLTLTGQDRLVA